MTAIALIPARGGSKRISGKNTRLLNGVPLLAYTIRAAIDSGCFEKVLVSSDDTETLKIATVYGADCIRRPDEYSTDTSPDIEWVRHVLRIGGNHASWHEHGTTSFDGWRNDFDTFSILRPTSPFRLPNTINRAFANWMIANDSPTGAQYSSLRAVSPVSEHPGKMWYMRPGELVPVHPQPKQPFHDSQMVSLPPVWIQNASLEIAWTKTVEETGTISGTRVLPCVTEGYEGFDLNSEMDWMVAEQMITNGVELPDVAV